MKLGFVSAILPDLSLEEVLQFAKQEGYDCVELMCWPKGKAERSPLFQKNLSLYFPIQQFRKLKLLNYITHLLN